MRAPRTTLLHDRRGAIMVLGLVMAVFLTGTLYYVVGIAEVITQRETMQDAADAGAFSAAVLHARGMNVIALINMVMAALLAVLVALKLLEAVLGVAIVLLAAAAFFTGGATASAIPTVEAIRRDVRASHDGLKPAIHGSLTALHTAARGVRAIVPWTAQLRMLQVVRQNGPHARAGFALPGRVALPTADGSFRDLCDEAGDYVGRAAALAIPDLPGGVDRKVGRVIGDLAKARTDWFCGASHAKPPHTTIKETRVIPALAAREACESYAPGDDAYDPIEHKAICDAAVAAERHWEPDPKTGKCKTKDCLERAERARTECKPRRGVVLRNWMYSVRTVTRGWNYREGRDPAWLPAIEDVVIEGPTLVRPKEKDHETKPPCGAEDALVAPGWSDTVHPDDKPEVFLPLCAQTPVFPHVPRGHNKSFYKQDIIEVLDVFGCVETKTREIKLDEVTPGERFDAGAGNDKAPQLASDENLGEDGYQIRAFALGTLPRGAPESVIRVASWSHRRGHLLGDVVKRFGHVSVAQAEYYFPVEDPEEPDSARWLWNMHWTARLRRVRLPAADEAPAGGAANGTDGVDAPARWGIDPAPRDLGGACGHFAGSQGDGGCDALDANLRAVETLIVH